MTITFKKALTLNELKELMIWAEDQETTDKILSNVIEVKGDHATLTLSFDNDGNITVEE